MIRQNPKYIIGLMAGTSLDGIDASMVETDGVRLKRTGFAETYPYHPKTRTMIFSALEQLGDSGNDSGKYNRDKLARLIAVDHATAAQNLITQSGIRPQYIGFHGQTLLHAPQKNRSIQCGDAVHLARILGIPVVHSFRQADISEGGQGAPLAPIYHRFLLAEMNLPLPSGIANIGGITNITCWDGERLTACDTGLGNAAMDNLARGVLAADYDKDGRLASQGRVDTTWLEARLRHPYFHTIGVKSLDRSTALALAMPLPEGSDADKMASLAALTAAGLALHAKGCKHLVISGGGAKNPVLVALIRQYCQSTVSLIDDYGIDGSMIEAELMAFCAARSIRGLPLTFPATTGVAKPLTGGIITNPK